MGLTMLHAVLGVLQLAFGVTVIAARHRIGARHRRRGSSMTGLPILWLAIGAMMILNGLLQLLIAFK